MANQVLAALCSERFESQVNLGIQLQDVLMTKRATVMNI
jgi:hypothetical protein